MSHDTNTFNAAYNAVVRKIRKQRRGEDLTMTTTRTITIDGKVYQGTEYPRSGVTANGFHVFGRGLKAAARRAGLRVPRGWAVAVDVAHTTNGVLALEAVNDDGYWGPIGTVPGEMV